MQCSGNTKAVKYPKNSGSGSGSSSSHSSDSSKSKRSSMSVDSLPEDHSVADVEMVKEKEKHGKK